MTWDSNLGKYVLGKTHEGNPFTLAARAAEKRASGAAFFGESNKPDANVPTNAAAAAAAATVAGQDQPLSELTKVAEFFAQMMEDRTQQMMKGVLRVFDFKAQKLSEQYAAQINEIKAQLEAQREKADQTALRLSAAARESETLLKSSALLRTLPKFPWIAMAQDGRAFCVICSKHWRLLQDGRMRLSNFIQQNGGADMNGKRFLVSVQRHDASVMHDLCFEMERQEARERSMPAAVSEQERRGRETMARLFDLLAFIAKRKHSLAEFEHLIAMLDELDVDVGDRGHSRNTARAMAGLMVDVMKQQLEAFLQENNPKMNHLPHIGVAADKTTDHGGVQSEMIHIRVNYNGTPLTIALPLAEMGDGSYLQDSSGNQSSVEAGGYQCFNKILEALEGACFGQWKGGDC